MGTMPIPKARKGGHSVEDQQYGSFQAYCFFSASLTSSGVMGIRYSRAPTAS